MILNIRGTSGSGKSTLARRIMSYYDCRQPFFFPDRKQPIGYLLSKIGSPDPELFVVGHYETACGGCDTIAEKQFDTVYSLVRARARMGQHVLYEGLLLTAEANRLIALHRDEPGKVVVIQLTTPLELCRESVIARRAAKGSEKPLGPNFRKNLESKHKAGLATLRRFQAAGVTCFECDRDQAEATACEVLGL